MSASDMRDRCESGPRMSLRSCGLQLRRKVEAPALAAFRNRQEIGRLQAGARYRGIATALLREAERLAIAHGRWLLVLDTAEDEGAAGLYERVGFKLTGVIPDYAFKPHGGLTGTLIYWKRLQDSVPA